MVIEDIYSKVFGYLKKHGRVNTFKLARELGIKRHKILNIIRELEEKGALEFKSGKVRFLKFPTEEKKVVEKPIKIKKAKRVGRKLIAKKRLSVLENLQAENKKLWERLLKLEAGIKKQPNTENMLRKQAEYIEDEEIVKELQQKVSAPPKITRKTMEIKKVPVKLEEKIVEEKKITEKPKKIKLPKFDVNWIKNVQQLKKPKFIEQKVSTWKPDINIAKLNKDIQQLHTPKMLRSP